jgi:uncharacterized protein
VTRGLEESLARALGAWTGVVQRHARATVWATLVVTLAIGLYAAARLGVNTDNKLLLAPGLPFMRAAAAYERHFPTLDDSLLVVVDGDTPELTRSTATALASRLARRTDAFRSVYEPGGGPFFEREGLLYLDLGDLYEFADYIAVYQPVLAELARDPSVANLARLVRMGLDREGTDATAREVLPAILDRFRQATIAAYDEFPVHVSWEELMLRGSALSPIDRRVLVADPVLRFDALLPAGPAIGAIRETAGELGLDPTHGVRVRVTGNPALNHEEMIGIAWNVGVAGIASFLLVLVVLQRALRSLRMVGAAGLTLLVGLVWTAGFAALAVGRLSVVSISFGVLFIGLGVDFAIHLGMHYAEWRRDGLAHTEAARRAAEQVGPALVLCALTTSIGFFAFVPTDYRGVAELGLITGTGMFLILFHTLTFFPALLARTLPVDAAALGRPAPLHVPGLAALERHPGAVCVAAAALFAGGLALLPSARFDANVVRMRDPTTESVQAFYDILAERERTPWYANAVAPDPDSAESLAARLKALPEVDRTVTLLDYVPADQEEKLEVLADLSLLLDFPKERPPRSAPDLEAQVAALAGLQRFLGSALAVNDGSPIVESANILREELGRFLARVRADPRPEPALAQLQKTLLGGFPDQLARLQGALRAGPVRLEDLPPELAARMRAPDGTTRIQVFPARNLDTEGEMEAFSDAVRSVAPDATGLPINLVEFGRATVRSLREALLLALASIAALLVLLWRRIVPALVTLAPLVLASVLTGAVLVLLNIPWNFANVIVLPLLLGVGVDSGIHLVQRARDADGGSVLETVTARAVSYSAITTIASFGSLAFASHRGIASMGLVLVVAMLLSLAANLVMLPAALRLGGRRLLPPPHPLSE